MPLADPLLINDTGTIGVILNYGTTDVTGSLTATFIIIFILFVAIGIMFKMPMEWIIVMLIPLLLVMIAMDSALLAVFFGIIIVLAVIFIRNLMIQ